MKNIFIVILVILIESVFSYGQLPQGKITKTPGLKEINVSGNIKTVLLKGTYEGFVIDSKDIKNTGVTWSFKKGCLTLKKNSGDGSNPTSTDMNITIYVYFHKLSRITASGLATIVNLSVIEVPYFAVFASGNTFLSLNLKVERLKVDLNGQAKLSVKGNCTQETITTDSFSKYYGGDLYAQDAICDAHGSSSIKVQVYRELRTNGSPNITYIGNPTSVNGENVKR